MLKSKQNIIVPPIIKVGNNKTAETAAKKSSHSVVVHQSSKPVENLYQALAKTEALRRQDVEAA